MYCTLRPQESVNKDHNRKQEKTGVNCFIVPRKPVGEKNIKVVFLGIRILPRDQRNGANRFKNQQYNPFGQHQAYTNPDPAVYSIDDNGIKQVKQYHIVKYPNYGMQQFYIKQLSIHSLYGFAAAPLR